MKIKSLFKLENKRYSAYKSSDSNFSVLSFFLLDDIYCSRQSFEDIKNWLSDPQKIEFCFNMTSIEKEDDLILLDTDFFDSFIEIKRENFIEILNQWKKICEEKPKEVIIKQKSDGTILLEGNNNVVRDALIKLYKNNYRQGGYNDTSLRNLTLFLTHEFKTEGLSHSYIFGTWLKSPQDTYLEDEYLLLEKTNGQIQISFGSGKDKPVFTSTPEKLHKIYKNFQEIKLLNPKVIRAFKDGDQIKLEGMESEI